MGFNPWKARLQIRRRDSDGHRARDGASVEIHAYLHDRRLVVPVTKVRRAGGRLPHGMLNCDHFAHPG